jgi:hypothetical protein
MSEPTSKEPTPPWRPVTPSLLRTGGALGLAGTTIGMLIFVVGCFGFGAVYRGFPIIPLLFSIAGLVLTFIGAIRPSPIDEDTHVLAALFANAIALIAALLEIGVWQGWNFFYTAPTS